MQVKYIVILPRFLMDNTKISKELKQVRNKYYLIINLFLCSTAWGWTDPVGLACPPSHPERILRHREVFSLEGTATISCSDLHLCRLCASFKQLPPQFQ